MPTHPRSYSPAAAEKLRHALLALAAAATAVAVTPGCTVADARPQKPDESAPPVLDDNRQDQKPIDDIPLGGVAPFLPPTDRTPPPVSTNVPPRPPRLGGVPIRMPQADPPAGGKAGSVGREAGPVPGTSTPVSASPLAPKDGFRVYTVQPGDTLSAIAQRYKVRQKSIVEANDIADPNRIRAHQQLYIPTEKDPVYTQRTGGRLVPAPAPSSADPTP